MLLGCSPQNRQMNFPFPLKSNLRFLGVRLGIGSLIKHDLTFTFPILGCSPCNRKYLMAMFLVFALESVFYQVLLTSSNFDIRGVCPGIIFVHFFNCLFFRRCSPLFPLALSENILVKQCVTHKVEITNEKTLNTWRNIEQMKNDLLGLNTS